MAASTGPGPLNMTLILLLASASHGTYASSLPKISPSSGRVAGGWRLPSDQNPWSPSALALRGGGFNPDTESPSMDLGILHKVEGAKLWSKGDHARAAEEFSLALAALPKESFADGERVNCLNNLAACKLKLNQVPAAHPPSSRATPLIAICIPSPLPPSRRRTLSSSAPRSCLLTPRTRRRGCDAGWRSRSSGSMP